MKRNSKPMVWILFKYCWWNSETFFKALAKCCGALCESISTTPLQVVYDQNSYQPCTLFQGAFQFQTNVCQLPCQHNILKYNWELRCNMTRVRNKIHMRSRQKTNKMQRNLIIWMVNEVYGIMIDQRLKGKKKVIH
jgi:hypothetical protein